MRASAPAPARTRRRYRVVGGAVAIIFLSLMSLAAWYVRSERFGDFVRTRIAAQIEDATGGRVEIGHLGWQLSKLEFDIHDLTVHGLEGPKDVPYVHADRIVARAKVGSLFHHALGLRFLRVDHPVIHVIIYPDGSTNRPVPKTKRASDKSPFQTLFDFSINRADVSNGKLLINDKTVPLDFAANDLAGSMTWFRADKHYECQIQAIKIDAAFAGMRPFSSSLETQLAFWPKAVEVRKFTLTSRKSRIDANGRLDDFLKPQLTVSYSAAFDVADAGSVLRMPEMRRGSLNVEGRAAYSAVAGFAASGKTMARGVEWADSSFTIYNGSATAAFAADKREFKLENVVAHVMGGIATGELKIADWLNESLAARHGTARFQLAGLAVSKIASAFSAPSLPFDQLKAEGTANGDLSFSWMEPVPDTVIGINVVAIPPALVSAGELPVTASLRSTYYCKTNVFDIADLTFSTAATRLKAAGTIGRMATNLRIAASTEKLAEFAPLLSAAYGVKRIPVEVQGRGSFDGTVSGRIATPSISGHVQIVNFDSDPGWLGATAISRVTRRMHWDLLSADLQYGPTKLAVQNGLLRHDAAQVVFSGTAQLTRGSLTIKDPFFAQIAVHDVKVADLQAVAGYDYPVTGTVDLDLEVSGTQDYPAGHGHALLTNAIIYGQPVNRLKTDVSFVNTDAHFENLAVTAASGHITGSGAFNLSSHAFSFKLLGANLAIEEIEGIKEHRLHPTGLVSFNAEGSGTPNAPAIKADLDLASLILDRESVGEVSIRAHSAGDALQITGGSKTDKGSVTLDGSIRLQGDFPASAKLRFSHIDVDPILRVYARGQLTGHSSIGGEVDVRGSLRNWREAGITGELSEVYLPVENLQIRNAGPVRFAVANQALALQQLHLVAEDTDLSASGTVGFAGERKLELRAEGHCNLKIIQSLNPDFTSYGSAMVSLRIGGDVANPRTVGRIQIENAGVSYIDLPNGLSDINGTLVFTPDRLQVQTLTARTGGGTLDVKGFLTYGRSINFNLQAVGNDIRLRYPQGVSSNANAALRLTGTPASALLSGDIVVTKFGITPQFDLANYIMRSKQPTPEPKPGSLLYNVKMDIHVTSTPELQFETALAKLSGNVDLRLRGSLARPAVLGRVNITEGDISFNGTKYRIDRGDISFANPTGITPIFDIAANTRVRDYDITLGFHGSTDRLNTTYRSDPPLATADIIALLAFGRTREESAMQSTPNQNLTQEASNAILGQAVNATVSSRMQKLFGVSRIKIDPEVGGAENNPSSARVTIEQQVAKSLTVTYITDITRSNQQVISAEYNLTRAVSIVAVRDQYGILSFDVHIRHRKK
jgi:translocation and assembly module TamB